MGAKIQLVFHTAGYYKPISGNTATEYQRVKKRINPDIHDFFWARGKVGLRNSYSEAKEMLPSLPEMEFVYKFDTASFLQYINGRLNLADLQNITGVNRHQLSHYATGKSRPSSKTVQRIQEGITRFSEELRMVCLV